MKALFRLMLFTTAYCIILFTANGARDGNGSGLNEDPPRPAPIMGGFGNVLVGFGSDVVFCTLNRVEVRVDLGLGVCLTHSAPYIFTCLV